MARDFRIVTNVRVERLQDMTLEDTLREGFLPTLECKRGYKFIHNISSCNVDNIVTPFTRCGFKMELKTKETCPECGKTMYIENLNKISKEASLWFTTLWNSTAPKGYKWEDNPYVFVYEFEKVEAVK